MMKELFCSERQAFYRFATMVPVLPIPEEDWVEYIQRKFQSRKITAPDMPVRELVRLTG